MPLVKGLRLGVTMGCSGIILCIPVNDSRVTILVVSPRVGRGLQTIAAGAGVEPSTKDRLIRVDV